ncbi:MAG: helix-turn-helix domain-containing protein [archaeon]
MFDLYKITLIRVQRPRTDNINDKLRWLGLSLGLFGLRDKDRSCFRIFIELVKAAKQNRSVSSDNISDSLGLTRGTAIHHLNKLIEAGIATTHKNRYELRVGHLEDLVDEVRSDIERMTRDLKVVAREVDRYLDTGQQE